ncbi:MAG: hypothetical protein ABI743_08910 [bacterium]
MLDDYLDQPVRVQLLTGEALPDGLRFWGDSPIGHGLLWFGANRPESPLEVDREFHIPATAIAKLELLRKR